MGSLLVLPHLYSNAEEFMMLPMSEAPVLRLVGAIQTKGPDWDIGWFGSTFSRLRNEVRHAGSLIRYVGYEGFPGEECEVRFLGLEVERIEEIPEGMVAWELRGDTWTVVQPDGSIWEGDLSWKWLDRSQAGKSTGEFSAPCPTEWVSRGIPCLDFRVTQNAYVARDIPCDDGIHLVDYDPSWPQQYEEMARRLRDGLGDVALRVEHYGSTSIPGMPAKPVIDTLVEIPSFAAGRERAIPLLNKPECEYWWYRDHICFVVREKLMGKRTHHVHMAPAGHRLWEGIAFRDYMRSHPDEAARYAALKYDLAESHQTDREAYTEAKTAFIRDITDKALMRE